MCRSIKPLFKLDHQATDQEIRDASLQFVKKISGFNKPAGVNEKSFNRAVDKVSMATQVLLDFLVKSPNTKNK